MFLVYKKLQQNFRLGMELSLLEQEEHSLSRYVEEAKTRYDETKSFRHDIRNHITVMQDLLQNGKLKEAVSYIEDMDDMAEKCHTSAAHSDQCSMNTGKWWQMHFALWYIYECALENGHYYIADNPG